MDGIYTKWEEAEPVAIAFAKVASGAWNLAQFEAWESHKRITYVRDCTTTESM